MSNHTGAVGACQPLECSAVPKTPSPHADRRLVARYGAAALDDGYAAIPRVVIRRRHALGVTAAEWDYICEVWSYWCAERLPGPSVEDLARGLGVDQSTIRRHRASLERKGFLRIVPDGPYNRYDLRPLIDAAVGLARVEDHSDTPVDDPAPAPGPCKPPVNEHAKMHATKESEKKFDYDSISPPSPLYENVRSRTKIPLSQLQGPDDQALAMSMGALSTELGDNAPASSITRAANLYRAADVPLDRFLRVIDEAAARTRARQASIINRRRDGQAINGMPYLFAVLQDLLHPAPTPPRPGDVGAARRRPGAPGRRRHRRDAEGSEARSSYAVWSDSPPPLPISETQPVWRAVLGELSTILTTENFNAWLSTTRARSQVGNVLQVVVPGQFAKDWLEHKLNGRVVNALERVDYGQLGYSGERVTRVEYVVEAVA